MSWPSYDRILVPVAGIHLSAHVLFAHRQTRRHARSCHRNMSQKGDYPSPSAMQNHTASGPYPGRQDGSNDDLDLQLRQAITNNGVGVGVDHATVPVARARDSGTTGFHLAPSGVSTDEHGVAPSDGCTGPLGALEVSRPGLNMEEQRACFWNPDFLLCWWISDSFRSQSIISTRDGRRSSAVKHSGLSSSADGSGP